MHDVMDVIKLCLQLWHG